MNGFYLAAGFGSRMKEYTKNTPKPLLRVQGIRLLDYSLFLGRKWGISKAILNTHYLSKQIAQHLIGFKSFPIHISHEVDILGTAGGISNGLRCYSEFMNEDLLLLNPDTIFLPDYDKFIPYDESSAHCHLYLLPSPRDSAYTKIYLNKNGLVSFHPLYSSEEFYFIGLSILKKDFLNKLSKEIYGYSDLTPLWKNLSNQSLISGSIFPGRAIDVGDIQLYESLNLSTNSIWINTNKQDIDSMFV